MCDVNASRNDNDSQWIGNFSDSANTRGWTGTYPDLFKLRPDNTFLVGVSYWLNR